MTGHVPKVPKDEFHLMGMYFPHSSPTCQIMDRMRKAIFSEEYESISYSDTHAAHQEIAEMKQKIDESTPEFTQDLNKFVCGDNSVISSILLIKGDFLGNRGGIENVILPIDLGTNPWPLYQGREGYNSIDAKIATEQTLGYLRLNEQDLRQRGIIGFSINESSFHYFKEEDLKRNFGSDTGIDLNDLVRRITDIHGFIGTNLVSKPTEQEYREKSIPFCSYRQKQSLLKKAIRELCQRDPYQNMGDIISDWGAHRICFEKEEEAIVLGKLFEGQVKLDKFKIRELHTDDYYSKPKKTGFKSFNIAGRVSSTRYGDIVREIQIYDLLQHFNSQINEDSPAFHRKHKEKQEESGKNKRAVLEKYEYDAVLKMMFGTEKIEVFLPK
jgi:ppGpp synthetase/RelA/SpoT-type nucleotidyltranferase